jgi:hypothetical protein
VMELRLSWSPFTNFSFSWWNLGYPRVFSRTFFSEWNLGYLGAFSRTFLSRNGT